MKITRVSTQLLTARWTDDPSFPQALHSTAIIRIETDAEIEGLGELTWGYFAPDAVPAMVDYFQPALIGQDPLAITQLTRALVDDSVWWARSGAGKSVISGLELALWDLKALNVPVWQLLGGRVRDRIPVYASGGPSLWPLDHLVRKIEHYAGLGYRTAKLSTHYYNPPAALEHQARMTAVAFPFSRQLEVLHEGFTRLHAEFGDAIDFAIDGHQGGVPHPIPVSEAAGLATTLARGESLCGLDQFHDLIARGGVDIIQPDLGFVGGLHETVRIMHHAEAHNLGTAIHTGASMGPSLAASWHLAAASHSVDWLEHVQAASSIHRDLLVDDFTVTEGTVGLPTAPGLGVRLTPELIEKYRFVPSSGERT
jgi:L-alanine-DL-glutamate epimerase-like enolase superfamily enzyme